MSSKQYTPTATARPTWRDREAQKQREQRDQARKAAEDAELQKFALTEENFPTLSQANQMLVHGGPRGTFAECRDRS